MKKFTLHLDALICITLLLALSLGFNFYQRYQYFDLLKAHNDVQINLMTTEMGHATGQALLKKCKSETGWELAPAG